LIVWTALLFWRLEKNEHLWEKGLYY